MLTDQKVNLFIVGAAKAGTTAVFSHLATHAEVCMSPVKEPNYFSSASLKHDRLYYAEPIIETEKEYHHIFNPVKGQHIFGEASVSYLFYPGTAAKIAVYNPGARILILLRDPAERAFSHYLMDKKLGLIPFTFEQVFENGEGSQTHQFFRQYFSYGMYFGQVKAYLEAFPPEQVKIILFDQLNASMGDVLNDLAGFLELKAPFEEIDNNRFNEAAMPKGKLVSALYRHRSIRKMVKSAIPEGAGNRLKRMFLKPPDESLSIEMRMRLQQYYKEDILKLGELIHQNLAAWYE